MTSTAATVAVIGAGFAGSEAAWQLARRGIAVDVYEMRPRRMTEAHQSDGCAELVCSNSFKSTNPENAHGLLKQELAAQGSLILEGAQACRVPAGQALAVDRELFSHWITQRLEQHPLIRLRREEVRDPALLLSAYDRVILASGPLTSPQLADGLSRYVGAAYLYFYDAIAPVVGTDSINMDVAYRASRYGKGDADYLNCPLAEAQYLAFVEALLAAEKMPFHTFESLRPFEGCLPIEVLAERGPLTLAFGPMKPVGLRDPRTGKNPFAVVQLRQENRQATMYSMVGFQTKMTWPEQRRIFRTIPGLEQAEFARLGSMHRNTFLDSPRLLNEDLALKSEPRLYLAGQITGVEGYIESTAMGLYAAKRVALHLLGLALPRPGPCTMTGGLVRYVTSNAAGNFQPMNAAFGLLDPPARHMGRKEKRAHLARRAMEEIAALEALENPAPQQPLTTSGAALPEG
ncbi:MAG: methylenetetrahydrofolate--tRNA-(uracil(54)-C(5))-methyltransferase (FADH(2)-oxidizing) TrmFO [SAR324 cluster bacterium]|nr:methylenetetrahydrofolate--tRNA-(uracil(54)-C(5))-methyltransferase (FADH(2)-oxidizing) TrmFO [SAR324 cluster bacterium]